MLMMFVFEPLQLAVAVPMPLQLSCTESALSELIPVAVSIAPPVLSELLQPRPRPEGVLPHGQTITPLWPGSQTTMPGMVVGGVWRGANENRNRERVRIMTRLSERAGRSAPEVERDPSASPGERAGYSRFLRFFPFFCAPFSPSALAASRTKWSATTRATQAVSFLPVGTWRDSFRPCAVEVGPSTPVIRNWALGNFFPSMPMKGIEPPSPM